MTIQELTIRRAEEDAERDYETMMMNATGAFITAKLRVGVITREADCLPHAWRASDRTRGQTYVCSVCGKEARPNVAFDFGCIATKANLDYGAAYARRFRSLATRDLERWMTENRRLLPPVEYDAIIASF